MLAVLVLGACALPRPKPRPAPRPVSAEARQQADQLQYEATQFYLDGDYASARERLKAIFALDPGHADAKALLQRVKAAEKYAAPAEKP